MTQRSFHWNGASLGDADLLTINVADGIGYRLSNEEYESPFVDIGMRMLFNGDENRGVLNGWLNELAVTGVGSPVQVDTGGAIVYGMPYRNTSAVTVAVTSPTYDTRQDMIVLRRNWVAQTVRITKIDGIEGGGVPAMTQSPAPSGTGIYDIPLASLSITTGGVITVTDLREFCTFSTVPVDDSITTTHLANESADLTSRQTRTKRLFLGGGDWQPVYTGGFGDFFTYLLGYELNSTAGSTWGNVTATEEGWDAGGADYGFNGAFKIPPDYAGGTISCHIWWMDDSAAASMNYQWRSAWQVYDGVGGLAFSNGYTSTSVSGTFATGEVYRATARSIIDRDVGELIYYLCHSDNAGGTEHILFLGLELEYTGYL